MCVFVCVCSIKSHALNDEEILSAGPRNIRLYILSLSRGEAGNKEGYDRAGYNIADFCFDQNK